jgi:hypothetical protein
VINRVRFVRKVCGHSRLAGTQLVIAVDEGIETSVAAGRSHDDFAWTKPGFRRLTSNETEQVTNNLRFEQAGNS